MKIAYLGAPDFSATLLEELIIKSSPGIAIVQVICPPDKPVGRKKKLTPSPVKVMAERHNIPVSESIKDLDISVDLAILFAFGKIIPKEILSKPTYGFWNIHPSLLPQYRGASPTIYPILLGDQRTGTTLMQMDEGLDHGAVIDQEEYLINSTDTRLNLEEELTTQAFPLIQKNLLALQANKKVNCQEQAHSQATYTRMVSREDGYIPLSLVREAMQNTFITFDALPSVIKDFYLKNNMLASKTKRYSSTDIVMQMYRGLYGWPGIWTTVSLSNQDRRLKLLKVHKLDTGLSIEEVQLEGKKPIPFQTLIQAYPEVPHLLALYP